MQYFISILFAAVSFKVLALRNACWQNPYVLMHVIWPYAQKSFPPAVAC